MAWQPVVKVWLHSTSDASPPAALLLAQILPVFSVRRALPAGRLARLGATPDFHHGLLTQFCDAVPQCTWHWLKVAHTATFGCLAAEFRRGA
jgi:hypothetical protein